MAELQHRYTSEFHQLQAEAAKTRLQSIKSQLTTAHTFCRFAESDLEFGRVEQVNRLVERLRKFAQTVRRHLDERNYVPPGEVAGLSAELVQLESKITALEERAQRNSR